MSTATQAHNMESHSVNHYLKIWGAILVLFVISITIAQVSDNRPLVLITAFGIAIIQGILVAAYFMHLKDQPMYVAYLLLSMLLALVLLYAGTMADVNHPSGTHWIATDTTQIIKEHADKPIVQAERHNFKP